MKRTINQNRAIKHYLSEHPNLTPQMGVPSISVGFKDRVTGEKSDMTLMHLKNLYNNRMKEREKKVKSMKKELKENGHTIKSKPRAIRPPRGSTQVSITGDDTPEGEA